MLNIYIRGKSVIIDYEFFIPRWLAVRGYIPKHVLQLMAKGDYNWLCI